MRQLLLLTELSVISIHPGTRLVGPEIFPPRPEEPVGYVLPPGPQAVRLKVTIRLGFVHLLVFAGMVTAKFSDHVDFLIVQLFTIETC